MGVAGPGYKAVNLPDQLVDLIDRFVETNEWGYRNRAEVAASAVRAFLMEHGVASVAQLRDMQIQRLEDERKGKKPTD